MNLSQILTNILTNSPQYFYHCVRISILTNFALWTMSFCQELPILSLDHVTSSYVYIRLVLVTLLVEKIQWTIFYIAVFPTVSKCIQKEWYLALFFYWQISVSQASSKFTSVSPSPSCTHTSLLVHPHPYIIHQSPSSNLSFSSYFLLAIYGNFHI